MNTASVWFQQEVWRWRSAAAVIWSVLLVTPVTLFMLLIVNFHPLHPLIWITNSFWGVVSPINWLYLFLISICIATVAAINAKHFTAVPQVLLCRWDYVCSLVRPSRLVHALGHAFTAAMISWCLTAVIGGRYTAISRTNENRTYLNEQHVFIVLLSALIGLLYSSAFFLQAHNYLLFSPIQQSKFFRMKSCISLSLAQSVKTVKKTMPVFCLVYYLFGGYICKHWILTHTRLIIDDSHRVDSLWGMLDVSLLCIAAVCAVTIHLMLSLTTLLQHIYHTEWLEFALEPQFEQDRGHCLQEAMACDKYPLLQYLAYQDLHMLAQWRPDRRLQLFSLSHLGGHPHHWTAVSSQCISVMQQFNEQLADFNSKAMANGPMMRQMEPQATGPVIHNRSTGTDASGLSYRAEADPSGKSTTKPGMVAIRPLPFLTAPLPDAASRKLCANSQLIIWTADALSHLVSASFHEDRYGVVQKSLSDILTVLLDTYEVMEKHMKIANVTRKSPPSVNDDGALRFTLKAALKTALYRIVNTFGEHLESVPLRIDQTRRLAQFRDHRE